MECKLPGSENMCEDAPVSRYISDGVLDDGWFVAVFRAA
jgi:hypothetical protein